MSGIGDVSGTGAGVGGGTASGGSAGAAVYTVTHEQTQSELAAFRARHPDWHHLPPPPPDRDRLDLVWRALLARQNGQDVDDGQCGPAHKILAYGRDYCPPDRYRRLLILGCGTGREVRMCREAGWRAEGVTLGPMNVAFAREVVGVDVMWHDIHALPLPTGSFDAVMALQTLEHTWAPLVLLVEVARLLRPGGVVVCETPPSDTWTLGRDLHHSTCPTPRQAVAWLRKAGFCDVQVRGDPAPDDCSCEVVVAGRRWEKADADAVEPTIRELTGGVP